MLQRILKKYIAIVFVAATFMSVFHHHDDLKIHTDCQLCMIQNLMTNSDTPSETNYFTHLDIPSEAIVEKLENLHAKLTKNTLQARAPPSLFL
jgi:hypothetical protein